MTNKIEKIVSKDYDQSHFGILGNNYIKICILILDFIKMGGLRDFQKRQLLFPLMYNFRHAAELFLKSILLRAGIEFNYTHDLDELLAAHSQTLERFFKNLACPHSCKKRFDNFVTEIKLISNCKFAGKKIINEKDVKNEFFRFPHKKHQEEFTNLIKVNFNELRKQIEQLHKSFLFLSTSISMSVGYI